MHVYQQLNSVEMLSECHLKLCHILVELCYFVVLIEMAFSNVFWLYVFAIARLM